MADPYAGIASDPYAGFASESGAPSGPTLNPAEYSPQSPEYQARYGPLANRTPDLAHPVTDELGQFASNAWTSLGSTLPSAGLRLHQLYNLITNGPSMDQQVNEKRALDAPLMSTLGGKIGAMLPYAAVGMGVGSVPAAAAVGGVAGLMQPTTSTDQARIMGIPLAPAGNLSTTLLNTAVGAGTSALGYKAGDAISNWLTNRAAQPFMGWNQNTVNSAAADYVGSEASSLNQPAINDAYTRLEGIYGAARSPDVSATLDNSTLQAVDSVASKLNGSSADALWRNGDVNDLINAAGQGQATAEQLGQISSRLGGEATAQMTSKGGDRALGRALFQVQDHVDGLVGSTITDPELAAQYAAAGPQYRMLSLMSKKSALLNSATGDVNATRLGKFLQGFDRGGYTRGINDSDLYNAARWGQATGEGAGAPELDVTKLGLPTLKYYTLNNPASRFMGGVTSRLGAPVAPVFPHGLSGLGTMEPLAIPYLEQ